MSALGRGWPEFPMPGAVQACRDAEQLVSLRCLVYGQYQQKRVRIWEPARYS